MRWSATSGRLHAPVNNEFAGERTVTFDRDVSRLVKKEIQCQLNSLAIIDETTRRLFLISGRNTGQNCSDVDRSEEHTSELQSLMRISYAVFCLKKKTKIKVIQKYTKYHTIAQS